MYVRKILINNWTLGVGYNKKIKNAETIFTIQFCRIKHAKHIRQETIEKYFTFVILRYGNRIKVMSQKRTHIKQRIA